MRSDITRAAAGSQGGSVLAVEKHKASDRKGKPVPGYEIRRDILVGPWRTVRPCGRGGQGEVWQVKREGVGHAPPHALKACLSKEAQALRRFRTEVELLSGQKHEHVVPVVDARVEWVSGDDDVGCPYLVMPLPQGSIDTIGWLQHDPASMVDLFRQACEAIGHLHSQAPPILHRDLKPENILVIDEPFKAVVSDFGVAAEETQQGALTATGEVVGSRLYRACYPCESGTVTHAPGLKCHPWTRLHTESAIA
jgi:serine/threonine protein kinase